MPGAAAAGSIEPALRRVAAGLRAVAALWIVLLAGVAALSGALALPVVFGAVVLAVAWAALTVGLISGRRGLSAPVLVVDVGVSALLITLPALVDGSAASVSGAYPLSTVLLAAWARGRGAAFAAAAALAVVTVVGPDRVGRGPVDDVLFYLLTAVVAVYGLAVLRHADARRQAAEEALAVERAERIVVDRLAETAAHLHDSVLQTLALIQRRAVQPEVAALARDQEHDLRAWLVAHRGGRVPAADPERFAEALRAAAADVERLHGTAIEVVTAGDAGGPAVAGLVAAAREAMANAARHAGAERIDVYGEVEGGRATVWVRDRGVGFDLATVPAGRSGIAHSITGRLERLGGAARIDTAPGRGTEVELVVPVAAEAR